MKHKIIDNFLNINTFKEIQNLLTGFDLPWHYQKMINNYHSEDDMYCYFTHTLFSTSNGYSSYFNKCIPLIKKLDCKALIRVKCNLYPRTQKIEIHKPHKDYSYKHKAAIFYINTNNGLTILKDGTKIKSIENRLLLFGAHEPHSSTSTNDAKARININFNYF